MSFSILSSSSSSINVDVDYNVYLLDATSNNIEVYLPNLSFDGLRVYIKRVDNSSNTITVYPSIGNYIDGSSSKNISPMTCINCINYSSNWFILSLT